MKKVTIIGLLMSVIFFSLPLASADLPKETILRRDLVIELGEGLTTDAQLTFPAVGEGPFPGVLLVHGSGNTDMNEYLPPLVTGTDEPSRPFLQIAEYLSERGVAVLRYNKRGIGLNGSILNVSIVTDMTFQELQQDAEKVLEALIKQPEVDSADITILGHSEGTWIAPRIAIEDPRVKKIVLLSAAANNLYDILYYQIVERGISQFEEMDSDDDGFLSILEVRVLPSVITDQLIENSTGEWRWVLGIDPDEDGYISLSEERLPLWNQTFEYLTTAEYPGSKWFQSHFSLARNLDIIGNVSASVLILQGEGDTQTPVSEALLLEQRLMDVGHPDHTLITYPGLGHTFYPREGLLQWLGPIQDYVLSDLSGWLKDPERDLHILEDQLQTAINTEKALQNQLDDLSSQLDEQTSELSNQVEELKSESTNLRNTITELERRNDELQSALNSSQNLSYFALGIAIITVLLMFVQTYRKRTV